MRPVPIGEEETMKHFWKGFREVFSHFEITEETLEGFGILAGAVALAIPIGIVLVLFIGWAF
jgi:hypothetical protein